ncbi:hypothetical protein A2690_04460 [Candidatus Roizmanbacteria bacterium RIFCSPHIGHO2_01_FULL_39_12b]|uniref:Cohesin domain-containing protein n=1 Tax=Candidatus Roizmanbacteria bacterium RIFCSPHIGHO2_01_FULL_39_12b TaxID=1802030 RepID=A0A1F7GAE7_9BACT|nr:MAG: hypothetical protein A2690_04460 [Candidatus Roizmanbacteria bacterium RIFCSPHIGHO2_01_FULL_39_12b]
MKNNKTILIILVLILSTAFFWFTANRFLYPSRAGSKQLGVSFEQKQNNVSLSSGQTDFPVNIFLTTPPETQVTGATAVLRYNSQFVEYSEQDEIFTDSSCQNASFKFTKRVKVINDTDSGTLIITRIVDLASTILPSGRTCWGTVIFRAKQSGSSTVSFETTDTSAWEIVGPASVYMPRFDEPRFVNIITSE